MELQLGLSLPSNPVKELGFDLNYSYVCPKDQVLGFDLLTCRGSYFLTAADNFLENKNKKKRDFDEAFDEPNNGAVSAAPLSLPLLLWNNQPNDNHDPKDLDINNSLDKINDGDGEKVVGWPPINSWRKKLCYQNYGNNYVGNGGGSNSKYVKVKMEGMGIGRKVDLSLHDSYQALTDTLMDMFGKCEQSSKGYKLTYQDNEGDWLLAADVPWRTFIGSVQRLKLLKIRGLLDFEASN